jgi:hypothetical protein
MLPSVLVLERAGAVLTRGKATADAFGGGKPGVTTPLSAVGPLDL